MNSFSKNKFVFFKNIKKYNYFPKSYLELYQILREKSEKRQNDLNDIDVSRLQIIGGFGKLDFFQENNFFVDEWDVSNARGFQWCFENCYNFNSDISNWDVSNSTELFYFFKNCKKFNQPVINFETSNAEGVWGFFMGCLNFNQEVYHFKFNLKNRALNNFFSDCKKFNQDISNWNVSSIQYFDYVFYKTKNFKQDLSILDVSNAETWENVFKGSLMEKFPELMPEKFRSDYI